MGDPECQVILPRLKTDIVEIFLNTVNNKLKNTIIKWRKEKSMTIVLCSKGYPGSYTKNKKIENIDKINLSKSDFLYHAGTKFSEGQLVSNGGRVLSITSVGANVKDCRKKAYDVVKAINWEQGFYRKDIGNL